MTEKIRQKKGFTLMELMIVVAIIGILGALVVVGVIGYNRSLKVMELNNTAEEIYIAAQNHLTALRTNASASGSLKDSGYGTSAASVSDMPADLTDADAEKQWAEMYAFGSDADTADEQTRYDVVAGRVLPSGAVDGTVAGSGSSWIIEYNPSTYTVYGVFYTDGKSTVLGRDTDETITASSDLGNLNALVKADGSTRISSYVPANGSGSSAICVGYYGGSAVSSLDTKKLDGSISLKTVNAEKLYVQLTTDNLSVDGASAAEKAEYNIRIYLTVTGETSGAVKSYGCTVNGSGDPASDGADDMWKMAGDPQVSGSSVTYQIVLDDVTTRGSHFAEIFADSDNGVNFIPGENITVSAAAEVSDSLSNIVSSAGAVRVNSLFASLRSSGSTATSDTSAGTAAGTSGTAGSGQVTETSGTAGSGQVTETVSVANFRHLENLSTAVSNVLMWKNSSVSAAQAVSLTQTDTADTGSLASYTYASGNYALRAVLTRDLTDDYSWTGFRKAIAELDGDDTVAEDVCVTHAGTPTGSATDSLTSSAAGQSTSSAAGTPADSAPGSYDSISNVWLSDFDGNNKNIADVIITDSSTDADAADGLFGIISQNQDMTVEDVGLVNFSVTTASSAGNLAGRVTANSRSVSISNVIACEENDNACGIWSSASGSVVHTGGLIGTVKTGAGGVLSIDKCGAAVYVYSPSRASGSSNASEWNTAGGLIGYVDGSEGTASRIRITDSYVGGHTSNAGGAPYYDNSAKTAGSDGSGWNVQAGTSAGGFIGSAVLSGYTTLTMTDDYSTASADSVSTTGTSCAGGFIGYLNYATDSSLSVTDCYSTGLVSGTTAGTFAGLIGRDVGSVSLAGIFSGCQYLNGVNNSTTPAANLTQGSLDTSVLSGTDRNGLAADGEEAEAVPYDAALSDSYPYRTSLTVHHGDWPEIADTETNTNGNRLMIDVETTSDIVVIRLTGLQSGAYKYIVLYNAAGDLNYGRPGNNSGVYVVDSLDQLFTWNADGTVNNMYGSGSQNMNSVDYQMRLQVTKDGSLNHYELMLDNISGGHDNFYAFNQAVNGSFYYGEYISVRITDKYTKGNDPRYRSNCIANGDYVINNLFEDVFDPGVSSESGALTSDGSWDLTSQAVTDSINYLSFNKGADLPEDINTFRRRQTDSGKYVAVIKNARHLENLAEDLSGINTQDGRMNFGQAVQGCDIIWQQTWSGSASASPYDNDYESYVSELDRTNGSSVIYVNNAQDTQEGNFDPVIIGSGNELASYDGEGYSIVGLRLSSGNRNGNRVGLFGEIDSYWGRNNSSGQSFTVSHLNLVDATQTQNNANTFGALIGYAQRQLTLDDVHLLTDVYGSDTAYTGSNYGGGLVGYAERSVTVTDSSVDLTAQGHTLTVSGTTAGGLIGRAGSSVTLTGDTVAAGELHVTGSQNAGGLAGRAGSSGTSSVQVDNCVVTASDLAEVSGGYYTGGLIGIVNGSSAVFSGSHFSADVAVVRQSMNGCAGGLAGMISRPYAFSMDNCYASAYVYAPSSDAAGGLIGCLQTSSSGNTYSPVTNCYASGRMLDGMYTTDITLPSDLNALASSPIINVIGGRSAGGLIGTTDQGCISIADSFSTASVYAAQQNPGRAGGLIGTASGDSSRKLSVTGSYATGLVTASSDNDVTGSLIGSLSSTSGVSLSDDYVIGVVNPALNAVGNQSGLSSSVGVITAANMASLAHASDQTVQTKSYDASLRDASGNMYAYPYRISTTVSENSLNSAGSSASASTGGSTVLYFDGDWPELTGGDVQSITLSDDSMYLAAGGSASLDVTLTPYAASGTSVTWTSSDPSVAAVSSASSGDGSNSSVSGSAGITAVSPGSAVITALAGGKTASCVVYVMGITDAADGTDVTSSAVSVRPGSTLQLSAARLPAGTQITWSVDYNSQGFASVDSSGLVSISGSYAGGGTAQITATASVNGSTVSASVDITVVKQDSNDGNFEEWDLCDPLTVTPPDTRTVKAYYDSNDNLNVYVTGADGCLNADGNLYLRIGDTLFRFSGSSSNSALSVWNGSYWAYVDYHRSYADTDGVIQAEFQIPSGYLNGAAVMYLQSAGSSEDGSNADSYTTAVTLPGA